MVALPSAAQDAHNRQTCLRRTLAEDIPQRLIVHFEFASRGSLFIRVRVNGKRAAFIVDTGSTYTVIRRELIGIEPGELSPTPLPNSGAGYQGDAIGKEVTLEVGDHTWKKRPVVVMELSQILQAYSERIDGVLGLDFFVEYSQVTIDMKNRTITFVR